MVHAGVETAACAPCHGDKRKASSCTLSRRLHLASRNRFIQFQERFFVTLPENEVHTPKPGAPHAVDILAFIEAQELPSLYFETPYYLSPAPGDEQLYSLLRETLRNTRKIGIAYVVIQTRQHLAALMPQGQSLVLRTLRWRNGEGCHDVPDNALEEAPCAETATSGNLRIDKGDSNRPMAALQPDTAALAERNMKMKKSAGIVIQELDNPLEDDDIIDDTYLEFALRRRPHPPDSHARRSGSAPYPRLQTRRRVRLRR